MSGSTQNIRIIALTINLVHKQEPAYHSSDINLTHQINDLDSGHKYIGCLLKKITLQTACLQNDSKRSNRG